MGSFPTCASVGPAGWIEHGEQTAWFGVSADGEADGNGGHCPLFDPNLYDQDECFGDGDAGLLIPPSHTIKGAVGDEFYFTCAGDMFGALGSTCESVLWGSNIDIEVHNHMPTQKIAYLNMLVDWNRDGTWSGMMSCSTGTVYEHVLANFPIPNPYDGKLSSLVPPPITIGPTPGYLWVRFSITEKPVPAYEWDGSGAFAVGETEDYLLYVRRAQVPVQGCEWQEGDPHKMHWPQMPDLSPTGLDVVMYPNAVADDFLCTESGPIKGIHFWASFANDCLPAGGVDSVDFTVKLYNDIPADAAQPYGQPGILLWSAVFNSGEYTVNQLPEAPQGWYDPGTGTHQANSDTAVYQYSFCPDEAFVQQEGSIYWLQIKPIYWFSYPASTVPDFLIGWKSTTSQLHWNGGAVWQDSNAGWLPLQYPQGHALAGNVDLAFVVTSDSSGIPEYNSKWSQPPIESDLLAEPPIFCGWDEPAHASRPAGIGVTIWQLVADDFRCLGSMPVTAIHWWGSYLGWEQSVPPQGRPSSWHVAFWNNVSADDIYQYSRPSGPLWQLDVPADEVDEQYVGSDRFPGKPADACFKYALRLDSPQFFQQQQYRNQTQDDIFWISITALYEDNALPAYPWGWKTRPQPSMGDAIQVTIHRDVISENVMLVPSAITPIRSHAICDTGEGYDMAFQLDTDSSFAKWEQSFTGIRHWPHYEDEESVASVVGASDVGVLSQESIVHRVADDFQYGDPHPITAAVWWGSYIGYDYTACVCQESAGEPEKPSYFLLSIWTDIPSGDDSTFSRPREKIWEYRAITHSTKYWLDMTNSRNSPRASSACEPVFRYSARIPQEEWFCETTGENVYWFSVVAVYETDVASLVHPWGWTNHAHYFGGDAVARASDGLAAESYSPLRDETGDGEDMSFMLLTDPNETSTLPYQPTSRPVTATRCPVVDTQCPAEETRCPSVVSLCVVGTPTVCPATHTQCPEATVCPEEPTQCYVVHTLCPGGLSDPTVCPPVETSCPVDETHCPIQVSRCIVCPGQRVQAPAQQASADSYVLGSCDRLTSASAGQSQALYERPCPIVDAKCPDIR